MWWAVHAYMPLNCSPSAYEPASPAGPDDHPLLVKQRTRPCPSSTHGPPDGVSAAMFVDALGSNELWQAVTWSNEPQQCTVLSTVRASV